MNPLPTRRRVLQGGLAASAALLTGAPAVAEANRRPQPLTLSRGVNAFPWFSLTREYPAPRTDYGSPPFQTGRPVPTRADLLRLRAAGLDFLRLPVDPGPFLAGTPIERSALLDMLADAVALTLDCGLKLVVNLQVNGATHYWNQDRLIAGPDAPGFSAYVAFAGEMAHRLASFDPQRVALEPVNEPPQACGVEAWQGMQRRLFEAARGQARDLTLVATGACGGMIMGLETLDPAPLLAQGPVLFTFHFYEPYLFSHQGAPWMREPVYRALNAVPWPAREGSLDATLRAVRARMAQDTTRPRVEAEATYEETVRLLRQYFEADPGRPYIDHYLDMAASWARRHAIPPGQVMLGEFGALRTDAHYTAAAAPDRARYVRDVRESAEAHDFPWAFWNLFDGMGVMDDTTRALDPAITAALGLKMPN
ncbi:glycoside hydrolase family 5 protein [Aureimonas sp. AU40]|uniref:glycoside hydrolase family 5 protein n=1 Tax=Aureimonas sp. AU40 TaxID=1637747 RepID=UPI0009ECBA9F|nr:cellulase family glycosylhydrolase [Aureimonas sp. AU40]